MNVEVVIVLHSHAHASMHAALTACKFEHKCVHADNSRTCLSNTYTFSCAQHHTKMHTISDSCRNGLEKCQTIFNSCRHGSDKCECAGQSLCTINDKDHFTLLDHFTLFQMHKQLIMTMDHFTLRDHFTLFQMHKHDESLISA